jgi:hypothetical protein
MTTYRITSSDDGVDIEVSELGGVRAELLAAFDDCRNGRCSCPTDEYGKVEAMEVDPTEDGIVIQLHARAGQHFDTGEISACVDHTVSQAARTETAAHSEAPE